jgi:peptidoglycan/xylan/chitin deacetylase (PgdA/CDA1 family)
MKYLFDPPEIVKKIFNVFQWNTHNNQILLTFDDGPIPEVTPQILKFLNQKNIKALFFCVGNNLMKNPGLFSEIISEGHKIGNHTFNHKRLTRLGKEEVYDEISKFNNFLKRKYNYDVQYFRPPHGRFNNSAVKQINKANLKPVMWSLLTRDYKNDINLVKFGISKYMRSNSIIVLHDSLKTKEIIIDSLKFIIEKVNENNFYIGEPSECLR